MQISFLLPYFKYLETSQTDFAMIDLLRRYLPSNYQDFYSMTDVSICKESTIPNGFSISVI